MLIPYSAIGQHINLTEWESVLKSLPFDQHLQDLIAEFSLMDKPIAECSSPEEVLEYLARIQDEMVLLDKKLVRLVNVQLSPKIHDAAAISFAGFKHQFNNNLWRDCDQLLKIQPEILSNNPQIQLLRGLADMPAEVLTNIFVHLKEPESEFRRCAQLATRPSDSEYGDFSEDLCLFVLAKQEEIRPALAALAMTCKRLARFILPLGVRVTHKVLRYLNWVPTALHTKNLQACLGCRKWRTTEYKYWKQHIRELKHFSLEFFEPPQVNDDGELERYFEFYPLKTHPGDPSPVDMTVSFGCNKLACPACQFQHHWMLSRLDVVVYHMPAGSRKRILDVYYQRSDLERTLGELKDLFGFWQDTADRNQGWQDEVEDELSGESEEFNESDYGSDDW